MLDQILTEESLRKLVDDLARTRRIIGPVRRGERYLYEEVDGASQLALDFDYCVFSPKSVLFPPHETLFTFNEVEGSFGTRPVVHDLPTAIVGVHPCDVHAIQLLDRVFAGAYPDPHYAARREATLLIGIDCPRPCTHGVFCRDMKCNEAVSGFDLMCYRLDPGVGASRPPKRAEAATDQDGRRYGVVVGTPAGRELVANARVGQRPTVADERLLDQYNRMKQDAFPKMFPYDVDTLPQLLGRSYDSLLWEATARRCYSCGSCNLSCPTCYCFNIYDELDLTLQSGRRMREWDGCHLKNFAEVAGGHNFRPKAASRLRHRIYRKAQWIKEREGMAGCVGCARCDRACTARINSVEIYNQLAEEG